MVLEDFRLLRGSELILQSIEQFSFSTHSGVVNAEFGW
jgi:hypothetical protein